jgi:deoxyadenosine/deoxycytidine kinase
MRGDVICIEGQIGIGKSTLGKQMETFLRKIGFNAKYYSEYVNQELLAQYISDMKRYSYAFQMIMLCKRMEVYRQALELAKIGGVAILDRSLIGDMIFAQMQRDNGNISESEWSVYMSVVKQENNLEPDHVIYLRAPVEKCLERIKKRGIEAEINGYDFKYLKTLEDAHEKVLSNQKNVTQVSWGDLEINDQTVQDLLDIL